MKVPNFCPSCGNPFGESSTASSVPVEEVSEEAEGPTSSLPNISKLEYSISASNSKITFGDLAAQAAGSSQPYVKQAARPAPPSKDGEDILKTIMTECASVKAPKELSD